MGRDIRKRFLSRSKKLEAAGINRIIKENSLYERENLKRFIENNPEELDLATLIRITELCNARREQTEAYYTNKFIVNEIMGRLPDYNKEEIRILEPSVGAGSFLPFLIWKYMDVPHVIIDAVDIDADSMDNLRLLLQKMTIPSNFTINLICEDFLLFDSEYRYDLAVGNPPFAKIKDSKPEVQIRLAENRNKVTKDLAEYFLEKCLRISDTVALVLNKTMLTTDEYEQTRQLLKTMRISSITDFGRYGFTGVSIETMCLVVHPRKKPQKTKVVSMKYCRVYEQEQSYITDERFPYFIIYRDVDFDVVANKLDFGVFDVFRDRQISKKNTKSAPTEGGLWVVKARNVNDDGSGVTHIEGYDMYISDEAAKRLSAYRFVGDKSVYLTPNMTYNPRVIENFDGAIPDGSVAVLIPKKPLKLTKRQMSYFSTDEYRRFYGIARNLATQSINVDKTSEFFYGVLKNDFQAVLSGIDFNYPA